MAAPISFSRLILIMASRGMGRRLSQGKTGSRTCLDPTWDFQAGRTCQPRCGLRRRTHAQGGPGMRFYTEQHRFYCGVDLHARTMYLCILDQAGQVVFDKNLPATGQAFLHAIAPFRDGLVVAVECLFCWYWLADLCAKEQIAFVLGHALYMKAIHGGKSKNDQIDAGKIARLLRGGTLPQAYVYPAGMRETRDLLRRRQYLVHKRVEAIAHIQNTNSQYNHPPFGKKLGYAANRAELGIADRFTAPSLEKAVAIVLALIARYDELLGDVELSLTRTAKVDEVQSYHRLQTLPGVGKILALVLLYEIHNIGRF